MNLKRHNDKKPLLPYFTALGWAVLLVLFVLAMIAGVELHDWLMEGIR